MSSLLLVMLGAFLHDRVSLAPRPILSRALSALRRREVVFELLMVALVTMVAFALRAYGLEQFPPAMHGDEGEMGMVQLVGLVGLLRAKQGSKLTVIGGD